MKRIQLTRQPAADIIDGLNVHQWEIWEKEESVFPWTYDATEICYILEGEVIVTPDGDESVRIEKGDLVTFPRGMSCTWDIRSAIRKHYRFED